MTQPLTERRSTSSLRVGVDLVRVADIAGSIARFGERYTARIFTEAERRSCVEDGRQAAQRFAARFAAKEATMKVLRPTARDGVAWQSIEVRQLPEGACEITLHDAALALATRDGIAELSLSMSHEPEYATATVVARLDVMDGA
jgi:holo-[acyl-carrier protein] synthase